MSARGGPLAETPSDMNVQLTSEAFCSLGDFYMKPDDTTRGVTLDISALNSNLTDQANIDIQSLCDGRQTVQHGLQSGVSKEAYASRTSALVFFDGDEAPLLPEDPLFQLESTTLTVREMSAAQIANSVMQFLNEGFASRIAKTNSKKFTIKAEVVFDRAFCEIKTRVYKAASREYRVEVQKRSGDTILFNRLYQCLLRHMDSCMAGIDTRLSPIHVEPIFLKTPTSAHCDCASFEPLYNLLEYSGDRKLQAEVVLFLAEAAHTMEIAAQMLTARLVALLQSLCNICFSITVPLESLTSSLATLPQAAALSELQQLTRSLEVASFT